MLMFFPQAWVRLALNDGLFESYLDAILRDKKTLVTYYRRLAYLRDPEQPSIMKSYLQGTQTCFINELNFSTVIKASFFPVSILKKYLYPPDASSGYFGLVFAMSPLLGIKRFSTLMLSAGNYTKI